MTLTHYIGGKLVGQTIDFPPSLNYPEFTTFINSETFTEYILVAGVWQQIGLILPIAGWKEVGRTTLVSAGDTIDVSSIPDKRYYMVLSNTRPDTGNVLEKIQLGNTTVDTGTNYARRKSTNGGTDTADINLDSITTQSASFGIQFGVNYIANLSAKEKLMILQQVQQSTAGAGTSPAREEVVSKWVNTSNPLDIYRSFNGSTGDFDIGSEVVVLGWDPADVHTDNFWEELASVSGTGSSPILDSGIITAKKYLWIQIYSKPDTTNNCVLRFNADTGTNYSNRFSREGDPDITGAGETGCAVARANVFPEFLNIFIINNLANEKLVINHTVPQNTAGAGTAPQRYESVNKWVNTSSQITSLQYTEVTPNNFSTASIMKVWGHD